MPVGGVTDDAEMDELIARLDAAVSFLYGLEVDDVIHIFVTFAPFHEGWDRPLWPLGDPLDLEAQGIILSGRGTGRALKMWRFRLISTTRRAHQSSGIELSTPSR